MNLPPLLPKFNTLAGNTGGARGGGARDIGANHFFALSLGRGYTSTCHTTKSTKSGTC
jgi:hypothetical protein